MVFQNFDKNLNFLFEIMFFGKFQSVINKRFNNAFVQIFAFHVNFSKTIDICFDVLQITVNTKFIFSNNATIKSMTIVLKNIVKTIIDINFS